MGGGTVLTGNLFQGCVGAHRTWCRQVSPPPDFLIQLQTLWDPRGNRVWADGDQSGRGLGVTVDETGEKATPNTSGLISFQGSSPNPPSGLIQAPWSPRGAL